ncbi:MAG TPA: hypothetical protein ENN40_00575 [Candidatus Aminicenantes bacterium]|nr:hypothetical protein [Candidatus Aminicenantes bacterium]
MTQDKFLQATQRYHDLKARLNAGEITVNDLKQALKKLMIVDSEGRYWMIGGKSGRWYRHDGTQWIQDDPHQVTEEDGGWQAQLDADANMQEDLRRESVFDQVRDGGQEKQETEPKYQAPKGPGSEPFLQEQGLVHQGDTREADLPIVTLPSTAKSSMPREAQTFPSGEPTQPLDPSTTQADTANCRVCDAAIPAEAEYCPVCGANQNETTSATRAVGAYSKFGGGTTTLQIRSIQPFSLLFLLGGLGLILGVIVGAAFGIFQICGDLIYQFPRMLQETRGKIQGGLIFGVLGGIVGFLSFALMALIASGLYNLLADLFGGLRLRIRS